MEHKRDTDRKLCNNWQICLVVKTVLLLKLPLLSTVLFSLSSLRILFLLGGIFKIVSHLFCQNDRLFNNKHDLNCVYAMFENRATAKRIWYQAPAEHGDVIIVVITCNPIYDHKPDYK